MTRHCAQALCPDERVCDVAEKAVGGRPAPPRHTDGTVPEPEPAGPFCVQGCGWSPHPLRTTTSSVFQGPLVPSAQQRAHSFPRMTWRPLQVGTLSRAEAGILERDPSSPPRAGRAHSSVQWSGQLRGRLPPGRPWEGRSPHREGAAVPPRPVTLPQHGDGKVQRGPRGTFSPLVCARGSLKVEQAPSRRWGPWPRQGPVSPPSPRKAVGTFTFTKSGILTDGSVRLPGWKAVREPPGPTASDSVCGCGTRGLPAGWRGAPFPGCA